ncbi:hypothetical protein M768_19375 [Cellulosimicrobium cellulans F16]|uniref:Uncharacterized protein n=1 Tax=Cellulosimicrobium cellulans F16 TaxID=1350482 RepID=A0A0M0F589_CELCE|nr:hypothetical protein [Cellulosimicrobium cellulans]KON72754.1 hypothetical protein M768_19375 [Cellulosimicrobium cellulans F16]
MPGTSAPGAAPTSSVHARARLVPGDVVRAAAAVSVVAAVSFDGVATALFLLVLGGTMVPRALGLTAPLDVAYSATLLASAWAAQLEWYRAVPWLDLPVHAACTGLVAAVAYVALVRTGMLADPGTLRPGRARAGVLVVTAGLGAVLAILWELGEWAGHTYLDDRIGVGYDDTVTDLAAGLLGAVVAGLLVPGSLRRGSTP